MPRFLVSAVALLLFLTGCAAPADPAPELPRPRPAVTAPAVPSNPACPIWGSPDLISSYLEVKRTGARTGDDVIVRGVVVDAASCAPIVGARVEFWHTDAKGEYRKRFRSAVLVPDTGKFKLRLAEPGAYEDVVPHLHLRISAPGRVTRFFTVETVGTLEPRLYALETSAAL